MKVTITKFLFATSLSLVSFTANGGWVLDVDAKTLSNGTVTLSNISQYSGSLSDNNAKVQINAQSKELVLGDLDLTGEITSTKGNTAYICKINDNAFKENLTLTSIKLPEKLEYLQNNVFWDCKNLGGDIVIPDSVSSFGSDVFRETGITSFKAGAKTKSHGGGNAFLNCASLETIDLSQSAVTTFTLNNNTSKSLTSLKTVKLPASCTTIGSWTLADSPSVETVSGPGVETVGDNAFKGAAKLESVSLPNAKTIGASAFNNCESLKEIELPSAVTIGANAFNESKKGLYPSKIVLGKDLESIGENAFAWHNNASSPMVVRFWGAPEKGFATTAFASCASGVHTIEILYSRSFKTVSDGDWHAIASSFGGAVPEVEGDDWQSAKTTWTIGSCDVNVVYFVDPDEKIIEIEKPIFSGTLLSYGYTDASFSVALTGFAPSASSATLTLNLYAKGSLSFSTNVTFASSASQTWPVEGLVSGETYSAILSCVDSTGTSGDDIDLGSFTTLFDPGVWTYFPDEKELRRGNVITVRNVSAKGTELTIGDNQNDSSLEELDFSGGVENGYSIVAISGKAFRNCSNLKKVVLADSVKRIEGDNAFSGCSSLESFVAQGLESLGTYVFDNDGALVSFSAPNLVSIGGSAFKACTKLDSVGDLTNVTTVGDSAFQNAQSLKDVILPSVVTVGSGAFEEQKAGRSPTNIVFGASLKSLGPRAFAWHNKSDSPLHVFFWGAPSESGIPSNVFESGSSGVHYFHILWSRTKAAPVQKELWQQIASDLDAANVLPVVENERKWAEASTTWNVGGTIVNVVYFNDPDEPQAGTLILIF